MLMIKALLSQYIGATFMGETIQNNETQSGESSIDYAKLQKDAYLAEHPDAEQDVERAHAQALAGNEDESFNAILTMRAAVDSHLAKTPGISAFEQENHERHAKIATFLAGEAKAMADISEQMAGEDYDDDKDKDATDALLSEHPNIILDEKQAEVEAIAGDAKETELVGLRAAKAEADKVAEPDNLKRDSLTQQQRMYSRLTDAQLHQQDAARDVRAAQWDAKDAEDAAGKQYKESKEGS
jgi:hypothetical protein